MEKKILFVVPRMGNGGAERVVANIANKFADKGNNVYIYTIVSEDSFYPLHHNIKCYSAGLMVNRKSKVTTLCSYSRGFFKAYTLLFSLIKENNFDIVISFLKETDVLTGLCRCFGLKFKHVCSERNDPKQRNSLELAVLKSIYKRCDIFVCQSKAVADFYHMIPADKKIVIANPIDIQMVPTRKFPIEKRIVAIGRLMEQKNFKMLIDSFKLICGEFPDYTLEIYGEGYLRPVLQAQIDRCELTERVILHGAKNKVLDQIANAALFVMPSAYEGFPNALLEAMAVGLPVISTDFATGVASELIGENNGLVVPVNDSIAMAGAIKKLLSNDGLRKNMGICNRKKAQNYDSETIMKIWEEVLWKI